MRSDLIIKLDDYPLTNHFDLTEEPDRGLFPEVMHELVEMFNRPGARIRSERSSHRIINLQLFALSGNFRRTKDDLADVLFSEGMHKLWFSDEPDRYWNVRLTGESSLRRLIDYKDEAFGELNFLVPDGLAHSIVTKKFYFDGENNSTVNNAGTFRTPIDIHATLLSDADSIGFVSEDNIVQLGTPYSEEEENFIPSNKVMNDPMGSATRNLWRENVGKVRWRNSEGEGTSQIKGSLQYASEDTRVSSFGTFDSEKPNYWRGPSTSYTLTQPLSDFKSYHRLWFKPTGTKAQQAKCQGLFEINYTDSDGNFIMVFVLRHNGKNAIASFFVGDVRIAEVTLPKVAYSIDDGFFGSIELSKVGNQFTFRLAKLISKTGGGFTETWSTTKSWYNETVAMLSAAQINGYMAVWGNIRPMDMRLTHSRVTQINTENKSLVPLTFYRGDEIFVEGETNRVYLNGLRADDYRVIGSSQVFQAKKGQTEITTISDGSFETYLEIRERFL